MYCDFNLRGVKAGVGDGDFSMPCFVRALKMLLCRTLHMGTTPQGRFMAFSRRFAKHTLEIPR